MSSSYRVDTAVLLVPELQLKQGRRSPVVTPSCNDEAPADVVDEGFGELVAGAGPLVLPCELSHNAPMKLADPSSVRY